MLEKLLEASLTQCSHDVPPENKVEGKFSHIVLFDFFHSHAHSVGEGYWTLSGGQTDPPGTSSRGPGTLLMRTPFSRLGLYFLLLETAPTLLGKHAFPRQYFLDAPAGGP